jgi:hypothetical protein
MKKKQTPRLNWAGLLRRTFALDAFACVKCGGRRRRVLLYLTAPSGVRGTWSCPHGLRSGAPAQGAAQLAWC